MTLFKMDHYLVTALVEIWNPKIHKFHLPLKNAP